MTRHLRPSSFLCLCIALFLLAVCASGVGPTADNNPSADDGAGMGQAVRANLPRAAAPPVTVESNAEPRSSPVPTRTPPFAQSERLPSPDGKWVALLNEEQGFLVLEGASATTTLFPAGSTISHATWAPDGHALIAVQRNWDVGDETMRATGPLALWQIPTAERVGEPLRLFQSPTLLVEGSDVPEQIVFGDWSPDGRYLLAWYGLWGASPMADGFDALLVDAQAQRAIPLGDRALLNPAYHSWAPDSSALAITMGGGRSAQDNKWLVVVELPSGEIRTLVTEAEQVPGSVAWSPTGELIAYAAAPTDTLQPGDNCCPITFDNPAIAARRIYLLDPTTGERWRLNQTDTFQDAPAWSANGESFLYVQRADDKMVVMAADPQTGQAAPVPGAEQPLPDHIGFYGQGEWEQLLAQP